MAKTWKGYAKKQSRRAWKAIKKFTGDRYGRGVSQIVSKGLPQLARDVKMLKSVINSEKLRISGTPGGSIGVGQTSGAYIVDITPKPSQGDTVNARTGSSIRLHSSNIKFQISQQGATFTAVKLKVMLVEIRGPERTDTAVILSQMFQNNPFNNLIDYNSSRHPDYMKDFRVLKTQYWTLQNDPASIATQTTLIEKRIGMKYKNRHVRFNVNGSTIANGQIYMIIMADVGNGSGTATTATNVITNAAGTGAYVNYFYDHYYYDN